jgi:hypothetical protein
MLVEPVKGIAQNMRLLKEGGPAHGYYSKPFKSIFVPSSPEAMDQCQWWLAEFNFDFRDGSRYVGGFIGTDEAKREWLEPKIQQWVAGIETLSPIAKPYPQTA